MTAPIDMSGKTVLITGFTSGVGKAAALALAKLGADLVLLCRNAEKGRAVIHEIREQTDSPRIDMLVADLGSQEAIRRAAEEFKASRRPLHILFNNAGLVNRRRLTTAEGYEATFAVNHLGPFLLTNLLMDQLRASAPSRVVFTGSDAFKLAGGSIDFEDLHSEKKYRAFVAYGRSKLGNLLFARELARREPDQEVTANVYHPGFVASGLGVNNSRLSRVMTKLIAPLARTPGKGAETGIYLCTDPAVAHVTGGYFHNNRPYASSSYAERSDVGAHLWEVSADLCGLPG
ncbi:MAG: SDR family NAD(P)-dependent oxidoreductase [Myxococcales bacterium]|nr:SDR family NAD(P)-dependent oxidoreductase [Myxococcales bacterium]